VDFAVLAAVVALVLAFFKVSNMRARAWVKNAPACTRKVIDVKPGDVAQATQKWEKLGYELHDREDFEARRGTGTAHLNMPVEHVVLTFIKT
jgi:hypothetical protein